MNTAVFVAVRTPSKWTGNRAKRGTLDSLASAAEIRSEIMVPGRGVRPAIPRKLRKQPWARIAAATGQGIDLIDLINPGPSNDIIDFHETRRASQ